MFSRMWWQESQAKPRPSKPWGQASDPRSTQGLALCDTLSRLDRDVTERLKDLQPGEGDKSEKGWQVAHVYLQG